MVNIVIQVRPLSCVYILPSYILHDLDPVVFPNTKNCTESGMETSLSRTEGFSHQAASLHHYIISITLKDKNTDWWSCGEGSGHCVWNEQLTVCRATLKNDVLKSTRYDQVAGWMQLGIHWPFFYLKPELAADEVHTQCMSYQRRVDWWKFAWWVFRHFITHVPPVYPLLLLMLATHHLISITQLI